MLPARVPSVPRASAALLAWALGGYGCATIFGMEDASCIDCTSMSVEPNRAASSAGSGSVDAHADGSAALGSGGSGASMTEPPSGRPPGGSAPTPAAAPPPDAGVDSGPAQPPAEPCARYCELITATCELGTGELPDNRAYLDRDACLKVCPYFPTGAATGNTLECRLALLESPEAVERSAVCQAAGRGGQAGADAICGSNCAAYCSLMERVCPTELSSLAPSCASVCAGLGDRQAFDVVHDETGGNTVQCRLWHVAVAATCDAADVDCLSRHCRHSAGASPCSPPAP